ncbi:MAG: helix-turn-helix transcriptional regulator [Gammaproteobacteria bacterium]|nr:helix-turn-helix transcriptional regulator [Gammaproteobacteria bacterium]
MTHHTLTTDIEIAAYLHRTRMDILRALSERPATVSQIGAQMNVHPANLTRHMRILEQSGLIRLVEKRDTGRNLEKYYASIAKTFDVAPDADVNSAHKAALTMLRSDLSAALANLPDKNPGSVSALLAHARISAKDIGHFADQLAKLVAEFQSADSDTSTPYHLNLSLYPSDLEVEPAHPVRIVNAHREKGEEN